MERQAENSQDELPWGSTTCTRTYSESQGISKISHPQQLPRGLQDNEVEFKAEDLPPNLLSYPASSSVCLVGNVNVWKSIKFTLHVIFSQGDPRRFPLPTNTWEKNRRGRKRIEGKAIGPEVRHGNVQVRGGKEVQRAAYGDGALDMWSVQTEMCFKSWVSKILL